METLHIATSYTDAPGGRFRVDGPFSGEEFREIFLEPRIKSGNPFIIDLDGTYGYAVSFLEEAFGGLARIFPRELVVSLITFKSTEDPELPATILEFINDAV